MTSFLCLTLALLGLYTCSVVGGEVCRPADPGDLNGACSVDGSDCAGEVVQFDPYIMNMSKWDVTNKKAVPMGHMNSWIILGKNETWEMYLHGPHIHKSKGAKNPEALPDTYVFATFTNQIYKFEDFASPEPGKPLNATQKMVGHALAPSTGFLVEKPSDHSTKGLMIAEGQPFWVSNVNKWPTEVYKGGVEFIHAGHEKNCTSMFPTDPTNKKFGQVVNTIDCHKQHGICFFTVWKFYDDQDPIWNPTVEGNDCLYYCILADGSLDDTRVDGPSCTKTAIVNDEHGDPICHKKGVGAVHGMTIGNDAPGDPTGFDILLVFTGKAEMTNGESSMKKARVQMINKWQTGTRDMKVSHSEDFATDLFTKYAPQGWDVGGDHAWVDDTGKYVWVSCFRQKGVGVHMLDYQTGELLYSITGIDKIVPNQYTYTAGLHGIGTLGQKGSYLAVATSSCHDLNMCIPTVPWHWPVPKKDWSTAPFVIIDLSTLPKDSEKGTPEILV